MKRSRPDDGEGISTGGWRDGAFQDPLQRLGADLGSRVDNHVEPAVAEPLQLAQLIEQRLIGCFIHSGCG